MREMEVSMTDEITKLTARREALVLATQEIEKLIKALDKEIVSAKAKKTLNSPKESVGILIIDDAFFLVELVGRTLQNYGYHNIFTAKNGKEGLEQFALNKPQLVIMDIVMPVVDGIEAATQMKRADPNVKIIMLSSQSTQSKIITSLLAGASDFLVKPFRSDVLHRKVESQLANELTPSTKKIQNYLMSLNNEDSEIILKQPEIDNLVNMLY